MTLAGKTLLITGASRGIGLEIGLRAARDGAHVVIAAKTIEPDPRIPGTIGSAAAEIENAGGQALAIQCDVRFEEDVRRAVARGVEVFGGIDIVINNAGALRLSGTSATPMKAFDLVHQVNVRAAYMTAMVALPHLRQAENPHILSLSPPIALDSKWLGDATAYTISKYGMTMVALGLAREFAGDGIASNALWPRTLIATSAIRNLPDGQERIRHARHPRIVAEAAYEIVTRPARECTGNCYIDDDVLRAAGIGDFTEYAVDGSAELATDLFLDG